MNMDKWKHIYYENRFVQQNDTTALICLDHYNQRVRLDHGSGDAQVLMQLLEQCGTEIMAQKYIAKIVPESLPFWLEHGYVVEAVWDGYFAGQTALGVCRYLVPERRVHQTWHEEDDMIRNIHLRTAKALHTIHPPFRTRQCVDADADALAALYAQVFPVYPTPIADPAYLLMRMGEGTLFYGVWDEHGKLVCAAAGDPDDELKNAEITDCATDPAYRGLGWTRELILKIEAHGRQSGWITTYALCRGGIGAINATMFDLGYVYRGRFTNNCRMEHGYENMNLWIKRL